MTIKKTAAGFKVTLVDEKGLPEKIALIKYGYNSDLTEELNIKEPMNEYTDYDQYLYSLVRDGYVSKWLKR